MNIDSYLKRKATLESKIHELGQPRHLVDERNFGSHVTSQYQQDAYLGKHPFQRPAKNIDEYIAAQEFFRARQDSITQDYDGLLNTARSNGQRWFEKNEYKIGIIADEFLYKSFAGAANLIPISMDNYLENINDIDILLITSAWRGLDYEWDGLAQWNSEIRTKAIEEIVPAYKAKNIPVVFYSKEDPPNYKLFLSLAQAADFIFTSAVEKIQDYKRDCPDAQRIEVLPFAIDYQVHNPIGSRKNRIKDVVFAGSWHSHKYPARRTAAEKIFDGVIKSDRRLRLLDRNSNLNNERYYFPERYLPYVENSISHGLLLDLHRTSEIAINLNSVSDSSTMYANRVVELQAMGCSILSNYSAGVNDLFPNVYMPDSASDVVGILNSLTDSELYRNQMLGLRRVYDRHVNFERFEDIFSAIGFESQSQNRRIAIYSDNVKFSEEFQKTQLWKDNTSVVASLENTTATEADLICTVSSEYSYGPNYLIDLVNATKFVSSDRIFKSDSQSSTSAHHNYSTSADPEFGALKWLHSHGNEPDAGSGYMIDGFEVTNSVPERIVVEESVQKTQPAKLSVIVPVYNNGRHLLSKCFESIRRSSMFDEMEVLLIDDGSTDEETKLILQELEARFSNVILKNNPVGGSGSASRPRNQGLALATADWVTYLDPDNEALSDGYARLYELCKTTGADFALGNMVRFGKSRTLVNNVSHIRKRVRGNELAENHYSVTKDVLPETDFMPMSIQALVANRKWLQDTGIEQPLGAVGQDSYFFQQMLFYASSLALLNIPIHSYFSAVSNSTVNTIGPKFFEKYIPLEEARSSWLASVDLLDEYNERRLEKFVDGWYLTKLDKVPADQQEECMRLIHKLVQYYDVKDWKSEKLRKLFGSIDGE